MSAAPAVLSDRLAVTPSRLLVINGNTTADLTASLAEQARAFFGDAARVHAVTVPFGPAYIASRAQAAVSAHAVCETAEREATQAEAAGEPFDACLLACFGEPGIGAVRERLRMPVAGMAEAAILTALQRGDRYAIVTVGRLWPGMLREQIRQLGLESRCAGLLALPGNALDYVTRSPATIAAVGQALDDAVAQGADVVIVAGAALAGFLPSLPRLPAVPVIDSYRAALSQVLALATLERAQRQTAGH
ncbi:aspartate/glutamate racemase family protein [Achromobacter ruhlandii]|uniref:Hydantoin racemase n=1 Tax=Achromobacter ruhlandii TaxID=72557 RepID=A0ABM8M0T3_9BURK|nr:aspartate/glutamate racemase family protein [Achromobacter ruhlandii]AKP89280.1 Asp/Glu/Hydantoin racemase [Achromobacter xylosoxidans]AOU92111.1 Asp/Glu/hydantoin racemase [Achromobacter ruhlandii]MCZ8435068.1 aspartate/glutamate racemase family protein [Achromobacter ruhlandii]MDC6087286.1 aspartate/glutamate racemase family protein [Achromobacter ruhlandii]MDC6153159.1 aspartate/glutamate racemase family protein [Achromobacter ruhlandii]